MKILMLIVTSLFVTASCKDINLKTENLDTTQSNLNINNKQTENMKEDKDTYVYVSISGDSVKNLDRTLRGIQNMKKAYEIFSDDSNDEVDGELISSIDDMDIASELYALAMRKCGVNKLEKDKTVEKLKTFFNIDIEKPSSNECNHWRQVKNYVLFYPELSTIHNPDFRLSIWQKVNVVDLEQNIFYFIRLPYFYNPHGELDNIYNKEKNEFMIPIYVSNIHRNKFIFNNDKSSLSWLLRNDKFFIHDLVKEFGYDKEKLINALVLNSLESKPKEKRDGIRELSGYFANKDCDGNLYIRYGLLEYIKQVTTEGDNDLLVMLDNYATELLNEDNKYSLSLRSYLTKEERIKVFAYTAYYSFIVHNKFGYGKGEKHASENWYATCALYYALPNKEITDEIIKNNYYNHDGIRKAFTDAMAFYDNE